MSCCGRSIVWIGGIHICQYKCRRYLFWRFDSFKLSIDLRRLLKAGMVPAEKMCREVYGLIAREWNNNGLPVVWKVSNWTTFFWIRTFLCFLTCVNLQQMRRVLTPPYSNALETWLAEIKACLFSNHLCSIGMTRVQLHSGNILIHRPGISWAKHQKHYNSSIYGNAFVRLFSIWFDSINKSMHLVYYTAVSVERQATMWLHMKCKMTHSYDDELWYAPIVVVGNEMLASFITAA